MRSLVGVLEAAALFDGDVDEHCPWLHLLYGLLAHQLRCSGTGHEDGANDKVSFEKLSLERGRIRNEGTDGALVLVVEALQNMRIQIEYRNLSAQAAGGLPPSGGR